VVVIAHRIHEDDLSGHLINRGKWRHLVLPLIAMSDSVQETDYGPWNRRKGEVLRSDSFDPEDLEELRANAHNPDFEMLYQQDADGRTLPPITEACFPAFEKPSSHELPYVMSVDASMTSGPRNSFNVIQIWCPVADRYFLVDQWRSQSDFEELRHHVLRNFRHFRPSAILIEKAANGHALISMMKPKYRKLIHEVTPRGSKTARLRKHIDTIVAKRISIPKDADWHAEFVAEFVKFPHGEFTDQVDATTQFLDWVAEHPRLEKPPQPAVCYGVNSQGQPLTGTLYNPILRLR
jgi:predicted phage terminase large subunit-like protein